MTDASRTLFKDRTATVMLSLAGLVSLLWVRSYFIDDHFGQQRFAVRPGGGVIEHRHGLFSSRGRLAICNGTWTNSWTVVPPTAANTRREGEIRRGWFSSLRRRSSRDCTIAFPRP